MPRSQSKYSRAEIDAMILETIENKESLGALSRKVGVCHASIYNYATQLGVYNGRKTMTQEEQELVLKMEKEGYSIKEIAEAVGRTYNAMQSWLQYRGLRLPQKHYDKKHDNGELTQDEIDEKNLIMATRKPKVKPYEYQGKTWQDITELYTGI